MFPKANFSVFSASTNRLYTAVGIWLVLCFRFVFHRNLGSSGLNEGDVLPLSRQFVDPQWMPQDWYLNQPAGYRLLFSSIAGYAISTIGWVATSVIGRSLCFGLLSIGLAMIARKLKLSMVMTWLVTAVWVTLGQSAIAGEWVAQGLEAKAIAYGFVFIAIGCLLHQQYRWMAVLLGIATSFHVLVGGYAFLAGGGGYWLNNSNPFKYRPSLQILGLYLVGSTFAIPAVVRQLGSMLSPNELNTVSSSAIYVFFRLPHHLNPLSWSTDAWLDMLIFLLVFNLSLLMLRKGWWQRLPLAQDQRKSVEILAQFTAVSLIPFIMGLLIAPLDSDGNWLQFYLFRFGDAMLPLSTYLLAGLLFQQIVQARSSRLMFFAPLLGLGLFFGEYNPPFLEGLNAARQFPIQHPEISRPWYNVCQWVQESTPREAIIITSPAEYDEFTWLTERSTIAKYKFLPQSEEGIQEWAARLQRLSNYPDIVSLTRNFEPDDRSNRRLLHEGYASLATEDVIALMDDYNSDYFVTERNHQLDFPIAYRNNRFLIYQRN